MSKRIVALLTIAAFMIFTQACTVYSTKRIGPDVAVQKTSADVRVIKVMKTSGEIVEFGEKTPAYIVNDAIIGKSGQSETISIPLSDVQLVWLKERNRGASVLASLGLVAAIALVVAGGYFILFYAAFLHHIDEAF